MNGRGARRLSVTVDNPMSSAVGGLVGGDSDGCFGCGCGCPGTGDVADVLGRLGLLDAFSFW